MVQPWASTADSNDHGLPALFPRTLNTRNIETRINTMPDENVELPEGNVVADESDVESEDNGLNNSPMDFFSDVWTGEWLSKIDGESSEDYITRLVTFRDRFAAFQQGANTLREKFDATVWEGHQDGTVPEDVKSIRAPRTGEKGGPKAKAKTAAELLLKK